MRLLYRKGGYTAEICAMTLILENKHPLLRVQDNSTHFSKSQVLAFPSGLFSRELRSSSNVLGHHPKPPAQQEVVGS